MNERKREELYNKSLEIGLKVQNMRFIFQNEQSYFIQGEIEEWKEMVNAYINEIIKIRDEALKEFKK